MKISVVKMKALVKNIKRERPDLAVHFSEHALTEIAKNEITEDSNFANDINSLTVKCIASMNNQFQSTAEVQKALSTRPRTWFHAGFVNNFISRDPETNLFHLNW